MRMRPTHGAAAVFAATLAATVGISGPAKAFFFLPIFQQSQSSFESKSGRSPGDNSRWRGGDRGRDEAAQPKPSIGTRAKRDEKKSSSTSSDKESQGKSEASSSQASRTRSVRQEPPPSKSSGRANASVRRESPAGGAGRLRGGGTLGDTFDEKLGEVFKARIDELIKHSN